jgi:putative oxidoreductase
MASKIIKMKKILSVNKATATTDIALLIARIGIAALMLTHGIPKLVMLFSGAPVKFPPVWGMSAEISLALTVFAEVFCSLFLLAGFATRLAAIPLAITMLVAALNPCSRPAFSKRASLILLTGVYGVVACRQW